MVKRIGMRRLAAFAAAAALVLGLVGCGGAQSTAQGNTEPVNLSVWTYYNGDQLESRCTTLCLESPTTWSVEAAR